MLKAKDSYLMQEVAGEHLLMPRGSEALRCAGLFVFNDVGAFVWHLLEQGIEESEIVDRLCLEYRIDKALAEKDTAAILNKLKENGLLEVLE